MDIVSRRDFLKYGTMTASIALSSPIRADKAILAPDALGSSVAEDEVFWRDVASNYQTTSDVINLENGYWGIMSDPVLKAYKRHTDFINTDNTYFARRQWGDRYRKITAKVADFLNVDADEIVLTRGATEALQALIGGYNNLKAGDAVLYADLDYSEMKNAIRWLKERRGIEVIKINFPEPATWENVTAMYKKAFDAHPNIKMMLMTHLNNWTGLISPVKQVAKMAKARGIDVILDAAHSVGQVDFSIRDLGADFVGVNLHKWVGAPIGCGVMYVKKGRTSAIDTYMGKEPHSDHIEARIDTGTANFAAYMTIPNAIEFHDNIGTKAKQARVKYLRDIWVSEVRGNKGIQIMTPDDDKSVAALTSFRLKDQRSKAENNAIAKHLVEKYGILTVRRTGPALGDCVRVTPSVYNMPDDMLKLAKALNEMAE